MTAEVEMTIVEPLIEFLKDLFAESAPCLVRAGQMWRLPIG